MIPSPPKLSDLPAGTQLTAGLSKSTVLPDFDFETYSPAGFTWDINTCKFKAPLNSTKRGLSAVGTAVYSEHPDTEVLSMAYDLKDGVGKRLWTPGSMPPFDLFVHLSRGGLLEAWNVAFEYWIWSNVCVKKYGWPVLNPGQLRCAMAKARAFGLPGRLDNAGQVLRIAKQKDEDGKRLLNKFSVPRNPTLKDSRRRIHPNEDPIDSLNLYNYNLRDIEAEAEISSRVPDLTPSELEFWQVDQAINRRGVQIDLKTVRNAIKIIEQAYRKYNKEIFNLTGGDVTSLTEIPKIKKWLLKYSISVTSLDAESLEQLLSRKDLPDVVKRVLTIRYDLGLASVKKLYSLTHQTTRAGRIHDIFIYHAARTGRAAGAGVQPQNLPNSGLDTIECKHCGHHSVTDSATGCRWCGTDVTEYQSVEWNATAMSNAIETINTGSLECVELFFGNAVRAIAGCLRGMFIAKDNHDLICSDYSAIEAVVLAVLAGEDWRTEVFKTHGKIYEMSASKITGIPFEEFMNHRKQTGQHHPLRKKVGKVAELASGYGGWINAWKQFGADEFFNDIEIKDAILAWRKASPKIVEMWGGQPSWRRLDYYGLEGAAVQAVMNPDLVCAYRNIKYQYHRGVLYCQLPSGRYLVYHNARIERSFEREGTMQLSYEGWNTNPKNGAIGWTRMRTYGGRLTENVVQAVSRDLLAHAIINLEKSGYPVVLHVHDEIVAEVPKSFGSVEEFEKIMSTLPTWAESWPVRASGGWRANRYAK